MAAVRANKLKEQIAEEATKRTGGRPTKDEKPSQNSDEVSDPNQNRTDAKVGELFGVSRDTVRKAEKLAEEDPEIAETVEEALEIMEGRLCMK